MGWSHNKLVIANVKEMNPKEIYSELLWECAHKGYKPGWVAMKFREIFGKWPRPLTEVEPQVPSNDLREYLQIMRNRWRQRRLREEARLGLSGNGMARQGRAKQSSASHSASSAAESRDAGAHGT